MDEVNVLWMSRYSSVILFTYWTANCKINFKKVKEKRKRTRKKEKEGSGVGWGCLHFSHVDIWKVFQTLGLRLF